MCVSVFVGRMCVSVCGSVCVSVCVCVRMCVCQCVSVVKGHTETLHLRGEERWQILQQWKSLHSTAFESK